MNNLNIPKVSVVIINWKTWHHIEGCLHSLRKLKYPNYDIIVVDNASGDDSPDKIAKNFPGVILVRNAKNLGTSGGNNVGMKCALERGSDYVWLLNNDTIVPPEALDVLVQTAETKPQIGMVSPVLYYEHQRDQIQYCGSSYNWKSFKVQHYENLDAVKDIADRDFWLWGTALLIKSQVIDAIGYHDEKFFVYDDDMEYAARAIKAGFINKIEPRAAVYHKQHYSGEIRILPLHYYYYLTRNDYFFWMKYSPWYKRALFLKKYLYQNLGYVADNIVARQEDVVDAYLDAMYCAFRNKRGARDKNFKMPGMIKKNILQHPYFWCDLAGCHFVKIIKEELKRLGKAIIKFKPGRAQAK